MIRILVVDDHPIVREGLAALIRAVDGFEIVAEAANAAAALQAARTERPDVILTDLHLPDVSGIGLTRQITGELPATKVLVLTMSEDDESIFAATRAGASGYLLKGATEDEILTALNTVAGGGAVFGASVAGRILSELKHGARPAAQPAPFPELTNREREILALLATGQSNHAIAHRLGLSAKTVANQLSAVYMKLHVSDRGQAIVRARDAGLVPGAS